MSKKEFDIAQFLISGMEGEENCVYDQPCKYGFRIGGHSVYCHNLKWKDAPRKCRRTWFTGGQEKDEDCQGFEKNRKE